MHPAIRVQNLRKRYHLAGGPRGPTNLTEAIAARLRRLVGLGRGPAGGDFWALDGVDFDARPGEVIGVVGRNGAGKSTLLKVLSRIVSPTEGRVELRGRVGSLLEVGTGFHPELTGRENVYLNGSILGMSRREIGRKFDEIVAFAGVEAFLDTPVKRYSSGMYVRLAFAVAAHLETEILIVDEVLAVGDAEFQKRCMGKLREVSTTGRTVLFVSHNMAAVRALCNRGLYLSGGRVVLDADPDRVIRAYTSSITEGVSAGTDLTAHPGRVTRNGALMAEVRLTDRDGGPAAIIPAGGALSIRVRFAVPDRRIRPVLGVVVRDHYGTALFGLNNRFVPDGRFDPPVPAGWINCHYPCVPLQPGTYSLDLWLADETEDIDVIMDAVRFEVIEADFFGSGKLPYATAGPVLVPATFSLDPVAPPGGEGRA